MWLPRLSLVATSMVAVSASLLQKSSSRTRPELACPQPEPNSVGICVEACVGHADCEEGLLCCSNGCGHVCMPPDEQGAQQRTKACSVIAVLPRGTSNVAEAAETVLSRVPAPDNTRVLKAVAMVNLLYGSRESDCCSASSNLKDSGLVTSVEFGDDIPLCQLQQDPQPAPGSWTDVQPVDSDSLAVWKKVLQASPQFQNVQLSTLGEPVKVQTQVVAGVNYRFIFTDGAEVVVFYQPWSQTLEVQEFKAGGSAETS
mmetsp:Transcript_10543/g.23973  ORF Transcript_10543/g.23973 Transcript_10543/m.23973 type:complete len:257 (+) Transcript_10543:87-857(+)